MTATRDPGLFLERQSYRRRRLLDGIRALPVLGAWLFLLPIFWISSDDPAGSGGGGTSSALIYIFVAWGLLIALAAALTAMRRRLRGADNDGLEEA